jgi:thiol-disulfide isomerase/thioredoxin
MGGFGRLPAGLQNGRVVEDGKPRVPVTRVARLTVLGAVPLVLAAGLGGLGLSGCAASANGAVDKANTDVVLTGGGVITTYAAGHRKVAPEISGTDLSGQPLSLAQYKGKVIVLNFWASWCPPCRAEAPALEAVSSETAPLGVQFVGVDIRESGPSDGPNFVAAKGITYPSFADQSARLALAFRGTGIVPETPPSTIVIDRTGHIAASGLGEMRVDALRKVVTSVAQEST